MKAALIETPSTLDPRRRMGDLLNRISLRQDHVIIERKGKPATAVVPVEFFRRMEGLAGLQLKAALAPRKTALSQAGATALANEAKHRPRKRKPR